MDTQQQVYDDSGKVLSNQTYDDNGNPISSQPDQKDTRSLMDKIGDFTNKPFLPEGKEGTTADNYIKVPGFLGKVLEKIQGSDTLVLPSMGSLYENAARPLSSITGMLGLGLGGIESLFGENSPAGEATPYSENKTPEVVNEVPPTAKVIQPQKLLNNPIRGALPAQGETYSPTRFYQGRAGIADAQDNYQVDMADYIKLGDKSGASLTSDELTPSTGSMSALNAANLGKNIESFPSTVKNPFGSLLPSRLQPSRQFDTGSNLRASTLLPSAEESNLTYNDGGEVINPPKNELPFNSNQVDVVNRTLSQHEPEQLAKTIDSNPSTVGQRPIPDVLNSIPVEPVIPSDITTPRAGQATPTVDVGKWSANIKSADKILDDYESTAPISNAIRNAQDSRLPFINTSLKAMEPFLGSNNNENIVMFHALDGKIPMENLPESTAVKVEGLRNVLDTIHSGLPEDVGYLSDYITHMKDDPSFGQKTLWDYFYRKSHVLDEPLQTGDEGAIGNVNSPFTERRTGKLLSYSTDLPKALRAYVSSIAKKKFDEPAVEFAKSQLDSIPSTLPKVRAVAEAYIRNYTNYDAEGQLAKEFQDWSNAVANTYSRSYLDWNIPIHMLHLGEIPSSVFPELGSKYTAIGAKVFASNPAMLTRELGANGLLQGSVIPPSFRTIGERYQSTANFWNVAESVTKGIAYAGAKARAIDLGMSDKAATMKAIADTKDMTYTVDPARMAKGLTSQSNIAGGQVSSRVGQQFKGVPLKIIEQYSNIIKNVKNNPTKAARLAFGATLAAGGTAAGLHTLHLNPMNLLKPTVGGPFGDLMYTLAQHAIKGDLGAIIGDLAAWATPGGQQVKQLIK